MYEEILLDRYKTFSNEELKEIKVSNGYTEAAERIALQLLSERKVESEENMGTHKGTLTSQDVLQNSDSVMTTEQINKMLYDEYKTYTHEELEEITYANGYTEEAEQIASQLLGKNIMESGEMMDNSYFILSSSNEDFIEDEDIQLLVTILKMSTVAFCFFSYSLTGKQILDELEKKIVDVFSHFSLPVRFDYHHNTINVGDADTSLFNYKVVESLENHFSAVFLYAILVPLTSSDRDRMLMEGIRSIVSLICVDIRRDVKINNCAISELYPTKKKDGISSEGIYFENKDLPKMLKGAKELETPYDTLLSHDDYQIPDWYENMENQTASSHSFTPPDRDIPTKSAPKLTSSYSNANRGGCYVATAIYGSYDCPEVWTLRRYRDYKLAMTFWGRIFIRLYYAVSPTIVRWVGDSKWFDKIWRPWLDNMVKSLRDEGFDGTPYEDRDW